MAFKKGQSGNPNGRPAGVPNKLTQDVRAAMALFAEANVPKLQEWIDRVAVDDPGKASQLTLQAIEYHIPKLGRTEVSGPDGGPVEGLTEIVIRAVDPASK